MSAVERALRKLREAAGGSTTTGPHSPIAQVERAAGAARAATQRPDRPVIQFDLDRLREAGLYSNDNKVLADQYRVIKRPLIAKAASPSGDAPRYSNLIAVASAFAGEGKTFTCINLALSIAMEKDWRVALVDADCKNPQLSRLLGAAEQPGLLDILKSPELSLDSATMATNIPGLSVMPLGGQDDYAAELFASDRMAKVCSELALTEARQLVIFDTSPLLLTTESAVVANHCGQVVVVVRAGQTQQQAVLSALSKIDASKAIGLVLNCATDAGQGAQYGSYGAYPHAKA